MGDLVHTLPALTDLAARFPALKIDWLAEESFADIARLHPAVDKVIPLALRRWRKALWKTSTWREFACMRAELNAEHYDVVLDSQGLLKSAVLGKLVKGGPLVGYDARSIREPLASRLYHKTYAVSREQDAVSRNRLLFGQAFGYVPDLSRCDFGVRCGARLPWAPPAYAVLLTATSRASKEWPEAHWLELGRQLHTRYGLQAVLPWGAPHERERAERLAAALPDAVVAPRMRLTDCAALLGHAACVVGVDTGLTHLANAVDVPLVAIYTDTDPAKTGVVAGARAVNLGHAGACPSVDEVFGFLNGWLA